MVLHCQWGICTGDVRYRDRICGGKIHRFPKSEADCLAWIRACARPHEQLNLSRINKNKGVCAGHFVGGDGPTASHPYPTQAEGVHKARPARKRASERASRQDRIGAESLDTYDAAVSNDADKGIEVQTDEQWISPLDMLALTAELEMAKTEIIRLQAKVEHLETNLQKEKTAIRQEQKRKQFGIDTVAETEKNGRKNLCVYYTGLTLVRFLSLFTFLLLNRESLSYDGNRNDIREMSAENGLFQNMCRLRQNFGLSDPTTHFGILQQLTLGLTLYILSCALFLSGHTDKL